MVRRAVVADEPGPVHAEHDVELLQADVVDDLVVGALQERRVDRRRPASSPRARAPRRTARRAARRSRRRSTGRAARGSSIERPVPPAIAAVMPITRGSRRASSTSAAPNTSVYCGGAGLRVLRALLGRAAGGGAALLDRARLGRVPLLHALEAALLGGREALALDGLDVHDHRPPGAERLPQRAPDRLHVVAVDHADVGEVELLEEEARGPERLQRLLQLRARAARSAARSRRAAASGPPRAPRAPGSRAGSSRSRLK